jgi:hypothetical protein
MVIAFIFESFDMDYGEIRGKCTNLIEVFFINIPYRLSSTLWVYIQHVA